MKNEVLESEWLPILVAVLEQNVHRIACIH